MTVTVETGVSGAALHCAPAWRVDVALPLHCLRVPNVPPKGGGTVHLRSLIIGTLALGTCAAAVLCGYRNAVAWQRAGGPPRIPREFQSPRSEPAAWIFVRPGCRHCADHLRSLVRAVQARPESLRTRILARICIVGAAADRPEGCLALPDSLRRVFGVRIAPTTWWIGGDGTIRSAWRGARGAAAWSRGVDWLAAEPGVLP